MNKAIIYGYMKCSTCKKAINKLKELNIDYEFIDISKNPPSSTILKDIIKSGISINKLFNTSGIIYRENNYKEKINNMSEDDKIKDLSENGMLVKRPILIYNNMYIIGYDENKYLNIR